MKPRPLPRTRRIQWLGAALAIASLVVAACGDGQPISRSLPETSWDVVSIDGQSVDDSTQVRLVFPDLANAHLLTDCRVVDTKPVISSNGNLMRFEDVFPSVPECGENVKAAEGAIVDAILTTKTWGFVDEDTIELRGESTVRLARVP